MLPHLPLRGRCSRRNEDSMVDLDKVREAIATLKRMGIGIDSFYANSETIAEIQNAGFTVLNVQTGHTQWILDSVADEGMGRGVGSRYRETLAGIPIARRD
jgi:hypothetical protein